MSISIIQKSDLSRPKPDPKIALVLSGGAMSGGAFKLGGLVALNRFLVNRKVTDFDIYIGLSAGGFIGAFLAGGLPPEELLKGIDGTSLRMDQLKFYDFYYPAVSEWLRRAGRLGKDTVTVGPRVVAAFFKYLSHNREQVRARMTDFLGSPTYTNAEKLIGPIGTEIMDAAGLPNIGRYIPSGIFDGSRIERYMRSNLEKNHIPNDFRLLRNERNKALYVTATNLNTARGVVFGHDADHTASISEAVQASTAISGFYVPARIHGEEYLDAMVRKTANASLARHKGADLIILYNPLRPFMNRNRYQLKPTVASLSDLGMGMVLNQTIRTLLQTRLYLGLEKLRFDPGFKGDVIVIEPTETNADFFAMNPLAFWNRGIAAGHGYKSVRRGLEQNHSEVQRILAAYGMDCDLSGLDEDFDVIRSSHVDFDPAPEWEKEEVLEDRPRLKLVK
ncbi:MAG: patatin-like phospholipase family protein [Deltaproteobacteria bacterium]|nr:patatin-like phospholipase family protein [Deltaproteobacteria bacterium]